MGRVLVEDIHIGSHETAAVEFRQFLADIVFGIAHHLFYGFVQVDDVEILVGDHDICVHAAQGFLHTAERIGLLTDLVYFVPQTNLGGLNVLQQPAEFVIPVGFNPLEVVAIGNLLHGGDRLVDRALGVLLKCMNGKGKEDRSASNYHGQGREVGTLTGQPGNARHGGYRRNLQQGQVFGHSHVAQIAHDPLDT